MIVERASQEKLQTIVRAEGEAECAKMLSDTIKDQPDFLELRKIEAASDISEIIARSHNKVYLNADNLLFNLIGSTSSPSSVTRVNHKSKLSYKQVTPINLLDQQLIPIQSEDL